MRVLLAGLATASLAIGLGAGPPDVEAQGSARTPRLALLGVTHTDPITLGALVEGLGQFGYVDGKTLTIEQRDAGGRPERLPEIAVDIARARPDVIFARGAGAVSAAKSATTSIPIVAIDLESDPVAQGFVKNLRQPGGNITGVFLDLPELSGKQLQLIREVIPKVTRVAILGDPALNVLQIRATEAAARALSIEFQVLEVSAAVDFGRALDTARRGRASAVLLLSSPLVFVHRVDISALARDKRLPAVSMFVDFAEAGGLMAYGPSIPEAFRRVSTYIGRILKGAKPAELPVERPEKFDLVINMKTARALGVKIPPSVLARADRIIE
jgi:putative ABC transport system substrate-binding protein